MKNNLSQIKTNKKDKLCKIVINKCFKKKCSNILLYKKIFLCFWQLESSSSPFKICMNKSSYFERKLFPFDGRYRKMQKLLDKTANKSVKERLIKNRKNVQSVDEAGEDVSYQLESSKFIRYLSLTILRILKNTMQNVTQTQDVTLK